MKRVLCPELPRRGNPVRLADSEASHLVKVLRLGDGDRVEAMDGKGHSAMVVLRTKGGPVRIEFVEAAESDRGVEKPAARQLEVLPITLEVAMLKGEAMEWVIEKAVELGVHSIAPTLTAHTVVQFKNKGPEAFRDRWQKIADQALKQCGRLQRLEVLTPVALDKLVGQTEDESVRLWCDEAGRTDTPHLARWLAEWKKTGPVKLLIGPEGGWSETEREVISHASGRTEKVSLGPLVLRAETAAISGISLLAGAFRGGSKQ